MEKIFITAERMEKDAWRFALDLHRAGYDMDWVVGVTRGGAQIAIYMQEVFSLLCDAPKGYLTVYAESYTGPGEAGAVRVGGLEGVTPRIRRGDRLLVVDDVFDRGRTLQAVREALAAALADRAVSIRTGALYYKPDNNETDIEPDAYLHAFPATTWLVFPHELCGLTPDELRRKGFPGPAT